MLEFFKHSVEPELMGASSMHEQEVSCALTVDCVADCGAVDFDTLIKNEHA